MSMDAVFKALADPSRRRLLDSLHAQNGQTLGELCEQLDMTRQAVTKHLGILEGGEPRRHAEAGPRKAALHQPRSHQRNCRSLDRQIRTRPRARTGRSQTSLETTNERATSRKVLPMSKDKFVYVTYIRTTPEKLWEALSDAGIHRNILARRVAGLRLESRVVLETDASPMAASPTRARSSRFDPPRQLVLSWQNEFRPELKEEGFRAAPIEIGAGRRTGEAHRHP